MSAARSGATYDGTLLTPDPLPSIWDSKVASMSSRWNLKNYKNMFCEFQIISHFFSKVQNKKIIFDCTKNLSFTFTFIIQDSEKEVL